MLKLQTLVPKSKSIHAISIDLKLIIHIFPNATPLHSFNLFNCHKVAKQYI